ncbi:hypothetical protein WJX79_005045 [Trebouxia sp. C0005]
MRKTPARGTSKRDASQYLASERVLPVLSACRLKVYFGSGALWLAVSQSEAKLLQNYAIGNSEGGPATAVKTSLTLGPSQQGSLQQSELTSVRLSPEEGIFLAHAVENIQFFANTGPCSLESLWHSFVHGNEGFVHSYVAYHHFRSKGWIPRSGLQYGTDLVLYKQHPSLVHSTLCILIMPVIFSKEDAEQSTTSNPGLLVDGQYGNLSWHDVEGINRLCVRVGKRLMLLYVQPQCADLDLTTPACLDNFAVAEHMVERWVPEATINLM